MITCTVNQGGGWDPPCRKTLMYWNYTLPLQKHPHLESGSVVLCDYIHSRAVQNCSFSFDINISGWQAFISKPISISILWKLDFETNTENEIALWAISIWIPISISKSPNFGCADQKKGKKSVEHFKSKVFLLTFCVLFCCTINVPTLSVLVTISIGAA